MTILYFIIAIGVLILVHELGHFIVARRNGIRVEKFSIGFGPAILKFKRGETEYKIAPIPIGGYVKMTGEDPDDAGGATDERSFMNKTIWQRVKVTAAGPLTNLVFALVFMPVVFLIGRMEPAFLSQPPVVMGVKANSPAELAGIKNGDEVKTVNGKGVSTWDDLQKDIIISAGQEITLGFSRDGKDISATMKVETMPEIKAGFVGIEPGFFLGNEANIDQVMANGPSAKAGLKKGDKVVAVNGNPVDGWIEMTELIHSSGEKPLKFTVAREGKVLDFDIVPEFNKDANKWVVGIVKSLRSTDMPMVKRQYGLIEAVKHGTEECVKLTGLTFEVLKRLFTGQLSYKSLGGPIQIAQASAAAAKYGLPEFIYFLAFLSIQLGILNLMPIPVLDGGHILFCGIEAVTGRKIPNKVRAIAQYVGLALLLTLFMVITVNDIDSVWGIKSMISKISSLVSF
ncbi:MAG: RIP metalloprotease RseP [Deltaproteobacteria bacterium CG11_big_fil_rev_8_21_14_0_20_49_13]|nr:MAG: RIP metalloprotease RseP [Deltaproteobacteria bacterium CG11_big_fil_rev_8_21_14_0_20_49_13]